MADPAARVVVFGAGSIGCFLGGRLAAAGASVSFVGRPRLAADAAANGLTLTDYKGARQRLEPEAVDYRTDPGVVAEAALVLVTVKSGATAEAADTLARHVKRDALVVSFQNGIGNDLLLGERLACRAVLAGMVPFNVIQPAPGTFHQATQGALDVARHEALAPWRAVFVRAGLTLTEHDDMAAMQWGKLLVNLNNAINALSGLPLKTELSNRDFRRCLALAQREALTVMAAAGIRPARLTPLPPALVPHVLDLPDGAFRLIAARMLAIDPTARSSMLDDLDAGRPTEVDFLNGEVVRLAERYGQHAPVNARLVALVHAAEGGGNRRWEAAALLRELRAS